MAADRTRVRHPTTGRQAVVERERNATDNDEVSARCRLTPRTHNRALTSGFPFGDPGQFCFGSLLGFLWIPVGFYGIFWVPNKPRTERRLEFRFGVSITWVTDSQL